MNNKKLLAQITSIFLVTLILTGCAATEADLGVAVAPQTCPTSAPLFCPTAAAPAMPGTSVFQWELAGAANAVITFQPGDKCTMQVNSPLKDGQGLIVEVVVKDNTYQDYLVWLATVDPGTTLEDLQSYTDAINPPGWMNLFGGISATPMSRMVYVDTETISAAQGPIYFTCQVDGPGARKFIGHVGPLEFIP